MRRSKSEPTITTSSSAASFAKLSVVGPGMGSARSNVPRSSVWQKYCERKSSCTQMICAPLRRGLADSPFGLREILIGVERAGHLNQAHPKLGLLHKTIVAALGIIGELQQVSVNQVHRALVLFDIDGTLVRRAGPHHRAALVHGIRRVTGLETTTEGIPVQGMLDPDILTVMMRARGRPPARHIRAAMPEILQAAERYYLRVCPELTRQTLPGRGAACSNG